MARQTTLPILATEQGIAPASGGWYFLRLRQGTDSGHVSRTAVGILPHQLFAGRALLKVTLDHGWPPTKNMEVQDTVIPDHAGRGAHAVLFLAHGEQYRAFGIVSIEARRTVRPIVMDHSAGRDHDTTTALLYSLYVPYMPTSNAQPQTSNIISAIGQWLGTLSQDGQREMGVATMWRVTFGDVGRR